MKISGAAAMIASLRTLLFSAFHVKHLSVAVWSRFRLPGTAGLLLVSVICPVVASEPLRDIIDRHFPVPAGLPDVVADDAEFLRRVSLDLNGMPPTADEARAFLSDAGPEKRQRLVDHLLSSPLYSRHLSVTLDVMIMERRPNSQVPQDIWAAYLLESVRSDKPWNQLAGELLTATGDTDENRAPARFFLDRGVEPHLVTRDLSRIFLGRDIQCSQCHDSPQVADFLQRDYHGLLAVASSAYAVTKKIDGKDVMVVADRSPTDLSFESVFNKGTTHRTLMRVPGRASVPEPFHYPGDDYLVPVSDGVRSVPKFHRRKEFAEVLTSGSSRAFNENIANRLWAHMFGRGLVHPLDMMHPDNPSASPELLTELGAKFAEMNFDIRQFLRELSMTRAYQRPFDFTIDHQALAEVPSEPSRIAEALERLQSEARDAATRSSIADDQFSAAEESYIPVAAELDSIRTQYADARKKFDEATRLANEASGAFEAKKQIADQLNMTLSSLRSAVELLTPVELPETSAELTTAAGTIAGRLKSVSDELPALEKAASEKAMAVTPLSESLATQKQSLDAVLARLQPLFTELSRLDEQMVAARAEMQASRLNLVSHREQHTALETLKVAGEQKRRYDEARRVSESMRHSADVAARAALESSAVVAATTASTKAAEDGMQSATRVVTQAQDSVNRMRSISGQVGEAVDSVRRAAEVLGTSAAGSDEFAAARSALEAKAVAVRTSLSAAEETMATAGLMADAAREKLESTKASLAAALKENERLAEVARQAALQLQAASAEMDEACDRFTAAAEAAPTVLAGRFALSHLKPLTPEQLCWSVFRVTSVYDRYLATEFAELEKAEPLTDEQRADTEFMKQRNAVAEQRAFDKLKGNVGSYVQIYGGGAGQPQTDFYASADQALFTANGGSINSWISPAGDNATQRIIATTDYRVAAEELYLGVLTRMPSEEEAGEVAAFLASRSDRPRAAQELVWGLLSSAEFRFNR